MRALTYMALDERRIGTTPPLPVLGVGGLVYDRDHSILVYLDLYFAAIVRPMVVAVHHVVSRTSDVHAVLVVITMPCATRVWPNALYGGFKVQKDQAAEEERACVY